MQLPIKPMLATKYQEPFDSEEYLFEIKWDGYRTIAVTGSDPHLFSRNGKELTKYYPEVAIELSELNSGYILDGELVVLDEHGKPDFGRLQHKSLQDKATLIVFDLLAQPERKLLELPLIVRRQLLTNVIAPIAQERITVSHAIMDRGKSLFHAVIDQRLEGMMAKKKNSLYVPGIRSREWLKIKHRPHTDAIIAGYYAEGQRLKSLILAQYDKHGCLVHIGNVGTGFSLKEGSQLLTGLQGIARDKVFTSIPVELAVTKWVQPILVAVIEYQEYTRDGKLRQPSFVGLRTNKSAQECLIEWERDER